MVIYDLSHCPYSDRHGLYGGYGGDKEKTIAYLYCFDPDIDYLYEDEQNTTIEERMEIRFKQ